MEPDGKNSPSSDFLDFSDLSEYWDVLDRRSDGAAADRPRDVDREPRRAQEKAAPPNSPPPEPSHTAAPRTTAPRADASHTAASRAGQRRAAPSHTVAARKPPKRRPTPQERRRRRRMKLLLALLLISGAIYAAANIIVFRVKDFQVSSATADQQVLSWKKSRGVDSYDIYDSDGTLLTELGADRDPQYAVDGLKGGTRYTYTIVAVKNFLGKHFGRAVECSAYTMPDTVQDLTAMNSGTGALLSWEDSGVSGYEVQYTDGYSEAKMVEAKGSDADGLSIPDLQEGAQYTFQVRGFVQDGESRIYSDWISSEPLTAVHTADMTGIDVAKPMVALTFDDGPDYGDVTDRILATLKEFNGHASFFQEGASASNLPELMTRIAQAGHEIASHTYDHSHYGTDVTPEDIIKADDAIEQAIGRRPSAFRSPGGSTTDLIRDICISEGMPIFYWSIDTEDWKSRDADSVCDVVMNNVSDGDIILMHNVYDSTADAVERIVPFLVEKGYQLVTVSQLVQAKTGKPPVPGTQYVTATITN